jgi:hypothetical protein
MHVGFVLIARIEFIHVGEKCQGIDTTVMDMRNLAASSTVMPQAQYESHGFFTLKVGRFLARMR